MLVLLHIQVKKLTTCIQTSFITPKNLVNAVLEDFMCCPIWRNNSFKNVIISFTWNLLSIQLMPNPTRKNSSKSPFVVYFVQLLSATSIERLVEILVWAVFNSLDDFGCFLWFFVQKQEQTSEKHCFSYSWKLVSTQMQEITFKTNTLCYFSMKYWRNWWQLCHPPAISTIIQYSPFT